MALIAGLSACQPERSAEDQRLQAAIADGSWGSATRSEGSRAGGYAEQLRAALGSFRYEAKVRYAYHSLDGLESELQETTRLDVDAQGRFALTVERSFERMDDPPGTSRREAVWDGQTFHTRTGNGRWLAWDPLRRGEREWLRTATRHGQVPLQMLAPGLKREREGTSARLSLKKTWRPPKLPEGVRLAEARHSEGQDWFTWWAITHRPTRVTGRLTYADERSDLITGAELTLEARTSKRRVPRKVLSGPEVEGGPNPFGRAAKPDAPEEPAEGEARPREPAPAEAPRMETVTLKLTTRVTVTALETPPEILAPPPSSVHDGRRTRTQHMIDTLVGPGHVP